MTDPASLFAACFPIRGTRFEFVLVGPLRAADDGGLAGTVELITYDAQGAVYDILLTEGTLLPREWLAMDDLAARLAAWCADFTARDLASLASWMPSDLLPAEYPPEARVAREEAAWLAWRAEHEPATAAELRARADAAVASAFARFPAVAAHCARVYGVRLPRHVAVAAAFFETFGEDAVRASRAEPEGVLAWFAPGGLERVAREGLDPRLHMRFRRDPPEFVTALFGDHDGLHWGLWYDDPRFLPSLIVLNYARDSAETWNANAPSLLGVVRAAVSESASEGFDADDAEGLARTFRARLVGEYAAAFAEADAAACAADASEVCPYARGPELYGSVGLALPDGSGEVPAEMTSAADRDGALGWFTADDVAARLAAARGELAQGRPAYALALGRVLHFVDADEHREASGALLVDAYDALGRGALAAIARVHLAHRDLPSVGIYDK